MKVKNLDNQIIKENLTNIENKEDIKLLLAIESGSRAWGFASKDSDFDIRGIYIRDKEFYLSINDNPDTLEIMDGDFDLSLWDLDKALKLFRNSNPAFLEWLRSPIVYKSNKRFINSIKQVEEEAFQIKSCLYHYLSISKNNYKNYIFEKEKVTLKKYFYVLRGLFAFEFITENNEFPPIIFEDLLGNINIEKDIQSKIYELLETKQNQTEQDKQNPIVQLNKFIDQKIELFESKVKTYKNKDKISWDKLDEIFVSILKDNDK